MKERNEGKFQRQDTGRRPDNQPSFCPACKMERKTWPQPEGYQKENTTYCCQGCADGTGCTCEDYLEDTSPPNRDASI